MFDNDASIAYGKDEQNCHLNGKLLDSLFEEFIGAKYLVFFSSRSLKTWEKFISFAQLVLLSLYIFWGKCVYFQFLNDKIHNYVKKTVL